MINWYRAMPRRLIPIPAPGSIEPPILIIWGRNDPYALVELGERSVMLCANGRLEIIEGAGHWAMWDAPDRVNAALLDFLAGS